MKNVTTPQGGIFLTHTVFTVTFEASG